MIKISVVIPLYNKEKYIEECLQSVLSQDFSDFEVIVVDDGSIDKSGEFCDKISSSNNKLRVYHIENSGVTAARKYGVEQARGKFIVFADADDRLLSGALQTLYDAIEKTQADEVVSTAENQYGERFDSGWRGWMKPETMIKDLLSLHNSFNVLWGNIYRRELLLDDNVLSTPRAICSGEDKMMQILILLKKPKVYFIEKATYLYNMGIPNDRRPSLERDILYEKILREALSQQWKTYKSYFLLYQIKRYEFFLSIGNFKSYDYYKNVRSEIGVGGADLPWKERLIISMPPYIAYLLVKIYKGVFLRTK
ncbi:MAG: glycosyltransferase family 2 protein [Prevotella sp.]|nr:glycosyltransferase family 2 protein [Prevotella sp.]